MDARDLFLLAKNLNPKGVLDEDFLPLVIGGMDLELRYSVDLFLKDNIDFYIFVPGTNFSRCTVRVGRDGTSRNINIGSAPKVDLTENEPNFGVVDCDKLESIIESLYDSLKIVEPDNPGDVIRFLPKFSKR